MSLKSEIRQSKPFQNPMEEALVNIIYTNNWFAIKHARLLKEYGLTIQQYNVLRILKGSNPKPLTINGIIERMLDKMSNASRIVDKLYQKNYVIRTENQIDRRACDVLISEEGKSVLKALNKQTSELLSEMSKITDEEAMQISNLLDKMRGSL